MIAGRPKSNVYTRVVAGQTAGGCGIEVADPGRSSVRRIEREVCSDGTTLLTLIFPTPGRPEPEDVLSFGEWVSTPLLAQPFAEALLVLLSATRPNTRRRTLAEFRAGFGAFLAASIRVDRLAGFELARITPSLVNAFVRWLDRPDPATGAALLAINTRARYLAVLRRVVETLRRGSWNTSLTPDLHIPRHVWRGLARQSAPTQVIDHETFTSLYRACVTAVTSIMQEVEEGRRLMAACRGRIPAVPQSAADYRDLGVCLAALDGAFAGILPDSDEIRRVNPHLEGAMRRFHGGKALTRCFYPSAELLIPFIVLLMVAFAYNPETVLASTVQDYAIEHVLGVPRVRASAYKGRAGTRQPRSAPATSDPDNPAALLSFLERWTERLRDHAPPHQADRVLLFVQARGAKSVRSFSHPYGAQADNTWKRNFDLFCKKHALRLTPRQVRQTVLDTAHDLSGGDLRQILAVGGQRSPQVIENSYTSPAARQRDAEALATAMALTQRDVGSGGKTDARRIVVDGGDVGAATPGWDCVDPYDSPLPDQVKGRLCQAYGRCPGCPLAQLDLGSPRACVQAYDLLTRIDEARERISATAWLQRWLPVRTALVTKWLGRFTPKIHTQAKTLFIPRLPSVE